MKNTFILFIGLFLWSNFVFAGTPVLNIMGRILKSDNNPLEESSVQFKVQIKSLNTSACTLYEETRTVDMTSSKGFFNFALNDGVGTRTDGNSFSFLQSISNSSALTVTSSHCLSGSGNVTYTPAPYDDREIKILFKDATMSAWEEMPSSQLTHSAYSFESEKVGGFAANNLLRVEDSTTGPENISAFSPSEFTDLTDLIGGTSTKYVRSSSTGGIALTQSNGNPTQLAKGSMWYDSVDDKLKYYDGSNVIVINSGSSITNTNGNVTLSPNSTTGSVIVNSTASSTSPTTGSLVVGGGVGIGENLNIVGHINSTGNIVSTSGKINMTYSQSQTETAKFISIPQFSSSVSGETVALRSTMNPTIQTGTTTSGALIGSVSSSLRNSNVAGDTGTANYIEGTQINYGHNNSDASTPTTNNAIGILVNPFTKSGSITNMIDIYLANAITGTGSVTNGYGIYQQNSKNNYFAGNIGVGVTSPSAQLNLGAGSANAGTSPLKFTSGTLLTNPEDGAVEYDGNNYYITSGSIRRTIASGSAAGAVDNGGGNVTLNPSTTTGSVIVNSNVSSVGTTSGALVVGGGVGVGEHLNVGGNVSVAGAISSTTSITSPSLFGGSSASGNITIDSTSNSTKGNILLAPNGGNVGIGISSPGAKLSVSSNSSSTTPISNTLLHLMGGDGNNSSVLIDSANISPKYIGRRSQGTMASPTAVTNGNYLLDIQAAGYGATGFSSTRASISLATSENWTDTAQGTQILFSTTGAGTTTMSERMRITSSGNIGIKTQNPAAALEVASGGTTATYGLSQTPSLIVGINNNTNPGAIKVWGTATGAYGMIQATNGNFHLDSASGTNGLYLNYYNSAAGFTDIQAGKIRVTNSGNVGIGTTTPSNTMDMVVTSTNGYQVTAYGSNGQNVFQRAGGTQATPTAIVNGDLLGAVSFRGYDGSAFTGSKGYIFSAATENWSSTANGTAMAFSTTANTTTTLTERMRIDNNGRVGIGVTSPQALLHTAATASAANATALLLQNNGSTAANTAVSLDFTNTNATTSLGVLGRVASIRTNRAVAGDADLAFSVMSNSSTTERMRIMDNGNVGIGTSSPSYLLSLNNGTITTSAPLLGGTQTWNSAGTVFNAAFVNITDTASSASSTLLDLQVGGTSKFKIFKDGAFNSGGTGTLGSIKNSSANGYQLLNQASSNTAPTIVPDQASATSGIGGTSGALSLITAGVSRLLIDSSGNVGIGTTSPSAKFEVQGTLLSTGVSAPQFRVTPTSGSSYSFGANTSISAAGIYDHTAAQWRLTIVDSSGNVGIGMTNPGAKLDVNQPTAGSTAFQANTSGTAFWKITNPTNGVGGGFNSAAAVMYIGKDTTTSRSINAGGTINASGADFAEWVEWSNSQIPEMGSIVKYKGSYVVISSPSTAAFIGNDSHQFANAALVAFAGQLPIKIRGPVSEGDLIVANDDGTGRAVNKSNASIDDFYRSVGTAWESSKNIGLKRVKVAIGIGISGGARDIASLKQESKSKDLRIEELENKVQELNTIKNYLCKKDRSASFCK